MCADMCIDTTCAWTCRGMYMCFGKCVAMWHCRAMAVGSCRRHRLALVRYTSLATAPLPCASSSITANYPLSQEFYRRLALRPPVQLTLHPCVSIPVFRSRSGWAALRRGSSRCSAAKPDRRIGRFGLWRCVHLYSHLWPRTVRLPNVLGPVRLSLAGMASLYSDGGADGQYRDEAQADAG